jgi:uncharacterized membrane protein
LASGRGARPPVVVSLVGVGMLVALAFPLAVSEALARFGVRSVAAAVLALGIASFLPLAGRSTLAAGEVSRLLPSFRPWLRALPLALPAWALVTGDPRALQLVPVAVEAMLAAVFLGSLRGGSSILQQAALTLEPYAPDFIGPYCRKATVGYALLFALQAVALTALVVPSAGPDWGRTASLVVWVPTLAVTLLEFALRKFWFRHYGNNPIDRVLRVLLPPENTARGRRSLEYIRSKRIELGMPPP